MLWALLACAILVAAFGPALWVRWVMARHSAHIEGTASDDTTPIESLRPTWRQLSGPGSATFADASSLATEVSFSEPGSYVLGLTVADAQLIRTDTAAYDVDIWVGSQARESFQQGVSGYRSCVDTFLEEASPGTRRGTATELSVDAEDGGNALATQVLLRFDDIFGEEDGQIPPGAVIRSATSSGCSTTTEECVIRPGISTLSSGSATSPQSRHSWSWRGLPASKE